MPRLRVERRAEDAGRAGRGHGHATAEGVRLVGAHLAIAASAFLVGAVVGLPRVARTIGSGRVPARPHEAVVTEVSSAAVVLATGAIGSPVSMTQAIPGGLVGSVLGRGLGSVRWQAVSRLAVAWVVTLPSAFSAAAGVTATFLAIS